MILLALTSGVAIILSLMVVGLMEAPWPILLSLLFLGLFGLQRLTAHTMARDSSLANLGAQANPAADSPTPPETQTDDRPICTYRGIQYRPSSFDKTASDEQSIAMEGVYRGQPWRRSNDEASPKTPPPSASPTELKYRGHKVK